MNDINNIDNELDWEDYLIRRGQEAFRKSITDAKSKDYYSTTLPARYETNARLWDFICACKRAVDEAAVGKRCRKNINQMYHYIADYADSLSYEVLGVLALRAIYDRYTNNKPMKAVGVATHIGQRIEIEVRHSYYKSKFDKRDGEVIDKQASRPGANPKNRRTSTRSVSQKIADAKGIQYFKDWRGNHASKVGLFFIEVAANEGIIEFVTKRGGNRQEKYIQISDELHEAFTKHQADIEGRSFKNFPLIERPEDWYPDGTISRENRTGGYHNELLRHGLTLARGFDHFSEFGQKAFDLNNTLQSTAWKVDNDILDLALWCQKKFIRVGSFLTPTLDRPDKGGAPPHTAADPELLNEWRERQAALHRQYNDEYREAVRARQALIVAQEYRFKTFYHSWSVDYRGRYYPQQAWLHPQATDFEKALIQFKDGCKVDDSCLDVVRQAVGAAYNGSRISFDKREQWTVDNEALITEVATNPKGSIHLWEVAKEPWQFLQLATEYYKVVIAKTQKIWHVPVGADATASGLQLLSAMRRDKQGMKYANLMPPEKPDSPPEDAYMAVLGFAEAIATGGVKSADKKVQKKLECLVNPNLCKYLGWRSVGKPSLMVSLYNGSYRTIRKGIVDALKEEGVTIVYDEYLTFEDNSQIHYKDTKTLADIILLASEMVFPAAFETLKWLYKVFDYATTKGKSSQVKWSTPTNDLIHCKMHHINAEPIYTSHFGKVMVVKDHKDGKGAIDKAGIRAASIPGFVHSYDSCLMKEAFSDWQHPIALTHDCYKCLPIHFDEAQDLVRQAFAAIVDNDDEGRNPLDRLSDDLNIPKDKIPNLPVGSGNLRDILNSRYMFN